MVIPHTEEVKNKSKMINLSISEAKKMDVFKALSQANAAFNTIYKGDRHDRQPVHTVYGGANLFKFNTAQELGRAGLKHFLTYAPNFVEFSKAFRLSGHNALPDNHEAQKVLEAKRQKLSLHELKNSEGGFSFMIYNKVIEKLATEAVEDFRIDFEDGFGNRPDDEEDATAIFTAKELAKGMQRRTLSPFIGIRIKPFTEELKERSLRTLDIFLSTLLTETNGILPNHFVVMLPKVTISEQVSALVSCFEEIEEVFNIENGSLKMEIMVETTQSIMDSSGANPLLKFIKASKGRCIATHFGTYDYTAANNITATYQEMSHPVCDYAHFTTKVALSQTGVYLSDGATNTMPIGPHRGSNLTPEQIQENKKVVHAAWLKGYQHIRHSLYKGLYQGWDLNPAQLPMRYTAVFAFFMESYQDAVVRLKTFMERAAQSTLIGDTFDDAATGQGLLNYFLKALNSGAISEEDISETGLTLEEIRSRSFVEILKNRMVKN